VDIPDERLLASFLGKNDDIRGRADNLINDNRRIRGPIRAGFEAGRAFLPGIAWRDGDGHLIDSDDRDVFHGPKQAKDANGESEVFDANQGWRILTAMIVKAQAFTHDGKTGKDLDVNGSELNITLELLAKGFHDGTSQELFTLTFAGKEKPSRDEEQKNKDARNEEQPAFA
jgi:hypothetical protein